MIVYAEDTSSTDDKSSTWPNGESQKIRDAYDRRQGGKE